MSQEYTLIGDLSGGAGHMQHQQPMVNQGQMQSFGMPPNQMQMQGAQPQMQGQPMQGPPPNQFDMINKYLADTDNDSDEDSSDDESDNDNSLNVNWHYFYNIIVFIMLAVILYYVWKIRRELVGMYEE